MLKQLVVQSGRTRLGSLISRLFGSARGCRSDLHFGDGSTSGNRFQKCGDVCAIDLSSGRLLGCESLFHDSCASQRFSCEAVTEFRPLMEDSEQSRRSFQVVVAATPNLGIGKDGRLPWNLPPDMKFFKRITSETVSPAHRNAVIMGRNTWLSIPNKFLPGRLSVVLSSTLKDDISGPELIVTQSLDAALGLLAKPEYLSTIETVFVIGGRGVFIEAMTSPLCNAIHCTEIENWFDCDTFMPPIDMGKFRVWCVSIPTTSKSVRYSFVTYIQKGKDGYDAAVKSHSRNGDARKAAAALPKFILQRHEEYQYLGLIEDILNTGVLKEDRTGTGTISKFGCQMRFNLRKTFPLLTTKRVFWRGVVEELLWFISGSTNAKVLQDKGVHIWDGNASRSYLDSIGLQDREDGDLGPVYGFQWRHYGAKYTDMHADYRGKGFDQLADVIHKLNTNPNDRRIVLSAWNPSDLQLMALPPCHMFAQFYVANGELSCQMYQRSCDMGLGVPFNIASYALLTCILAHVCDLVPGDLVHVLGDAHVYQNHVEPLREQLNNMPNAFPVLKISGAKDIDSLTASDFELVNYDSSKRISMQMAI